VSKPTKLILLDSLLQEKMMEENEMAQIIACSSKPWNVITYEVIQHLKGRQFSDEVPLAFFGISSKSSKVGKTQLQNERLPSPGLGSMQSLVGHNRRITKAATATPTPSLYSKGLAEANSSYTLTCPTSAMRSSSWESEQQLKQLKLRQFNAREFNQSAFRPINKPRFLTDTGAISKFPAKPPLPSNKPGGGALTICPSWYPRSRESGRVADTWKWEKPPQRKDSSHALQAAWKGLETWSKLVANDPIASCATKLQSQSVDFEREADMDILYELKALDGNILTEWEKSCVREHIKDLESKLF